MFRKKDIKNEIEILESQLRDVSSELAKIQPLVPEGAGLRVIRRGEGYQYFMRYHGSKPSGDYIQKKNKKTAQVLAQIEYDRKVIKNLELWITGLKHLCLFPDTPFDHAFDQMVSGKKELIQPHRLSDETYIHEWKSIDYTRLEFGEKAPEYYTRQGLRVRSKSEVIIADILDDMSIPFLYEKPLQIGSATIHPDFTLLNIRERRELYWEHFGMMDDPEYAEKAVRKLFCYQQNGYYQGERLIITAETKSTPLDTRHVRNLIEAYLL